MRSPGGGKEEEGGGGGGWSGSSGEAAATSCNQLLHHVREGEREREHGAQTLCESDD